MRIVNAELLIPTADEIKKIVKMAYETGRTRGREEAKRELQGLATSPDDGYLDACDAGGHEREARSRGNRMFTAGKW